MPALIAYLLSVGIFFGGGYLGLNFLAGNFESAPRTSRADAGEKITEKNKGKRTLQAASVAVSDTSRDAAAMQTSPTQQELVVQLPVESSLSQADLSTSSASTPEAEDIKPANIDAPPQHQVAVAAAPDTSRQDAPGQESPGEASDQNAIKPALAAAGLNGALALDQPPKAKTTQTVRNARLDLRAISEKKSGSLPKRGREASTKTKPRLVTMVLQTIEYPDGRREQRLVTQRQARAD